MDTSLEEKEHLKQKMKDERAAEEQKLMKRNFISISSFLGGVLPHHLIYLAILGAISALIQYVIDALCNEVNTRKFEFLKY